jgi:AcrR family transcriptional regulator
MILDSAFALMQEEGFEQVTARKLAVKTGCSTQPIFRLYENMDQLIGKVYIRAAAFFEAFCAAYPKKSDLPFIDLGMAYIRFASEEKHIFRLLFMSEHRAGKSMYELLNGENGTVGREVARAKGKGVKNPGELFFIHGSACMALTGDFDLSEPEAEELLISIYRAFTEVMG